MNTHLRLASASLEHPVSDPADRSVMPMSTLIASEQWLHEVSWDGSTIGDVQIFKNESCNANGVRLKDEKGKPLKDKWVWWAGVPRGKIKSYRFVESAQIEPQTIDDGMPFELPDAQRKAKPGQAGEGSAATVRTA